MPRTLPWLTGTAAKKTPTSAQASTPAARGRKRASSPDDVVDSDLNPIHPSPSPAPDARKKAKRASRTPSSSPPPAPLDVDYMREGFDADDTFMMVEDEFIATAKKYTQHIHHAEYVRRRKLARSRGERTISDISRATDGRTEQSVELKRKTETSDNARNIAEKLSREGSEGEEDDDDDDLLDPHLAALMTTEKSVGKDISMLAKARPRTRAAAGFIQSPQNVERKRDALETSRRPSISEGSRKLFAEEAAADDDETEDEDDLDAPPRQSSKAPAVQDASRASTEGRDEPSRARPTNGSGLFRQFVKAPENGEHTERREQTDGPFRHASVASTSKKQSASPVKIKEEPGSTYVPSAATKFLEKRRAEMAARTAPEPQVVTKEEPVGEPSQLSASPSYLERRKAEQDKKQEEDRKKAKRVDNIPIFLL